MKAVIFDLDGVLVDSMPYHAEAWRQAFASVDITINLKDIYELEGSNHRQIVEIMFKRSGRNPTEEEIRGISGKKIEIFNRIEHVHPFEGIPELLTSLALKFKLAVVSGSNLKTVDKIINSFFPSIFHVVITGDDVKKSKPSPEPYIKAVEKLGVTVEQCLVIENAPFGIRSAKSAGLRCIAVSAYIDREKLKEADVVVDSHKELGKYIHEEECRDAGKG